MARVYKATYTAPGPDGTRITKEAPGWYIEFTDAAGRTVRRKGGLTETAAKDALRQAEGEVLREKNGLPTRRAGDLTCLELLERYMQSLRGRACPAHCRDAEARIRALLIGIHATRIKELAPEAVEGFMSGLDDQGLAPATVNDYLEAAKAMLTWGVKSRLLPYNPLDCVSKRNEHEKRRIRRALGETELSALLAAALEGPRRRALRTYQNRPRKDGTFKPATIPLAEQARLADEGRNITLAYRIMLETGLRKNECRLLTWADLDLEAGTLTTRPEWAGNKNGKRETLPLAPGLLEALASWKNHRPIDDSAPVVKVTSRILHCLNDDLVAAGLARRIPLDKKGEVIPQDAEGKPKQKPAKWWIDKRDPAGRTLDLHALRHTFGTRLGTTPGIDPKSVQTLLRHSTPTMSFGVYVHSDKERLRSAVAAMPELRPAPLPQAETLEALKTGTDDTPATPDTEPLPLSIRQGKAASLLKVNSSNALSLHDSQASNLEVGGPTPSGRILVKGPGSGEWGAGFGARTALLAPRTPLHAPRLWLLQELELAQRIPAVARAPLCPQP